MFSRFPRHWSKIEILKRWFPATKVCMHLVYMYAVSFTKNLRDLYRFEGDMALRKFAKM